MVMPMLSAASTIGPVGAASAGGFPWMGLAGAGFDMLGGLFGKKDNSSRVQAALMQQQIDNQRRMQEMSYEDGLGGANYYDPRTNTRVAKASPLQLLQAGAAEKSLREQSLNNSAIQEAMKRQFGQDIENDAAAGSMMSEFLHSKNNRDTVGERDAVASEMALATNAAQRRATEGANAGAYMQAQRMGNPFTTANLVEAENRAAASRGRGMATADEFRIPAMDQVTSRRANNEQSLLAQRAGLTGKQFNPVGFNAPDSGMSSLLQAQGLSQGAANSAMSGTNSLVQMMMAQQAMKRNPFDAVSSALATANNYIQGYDQSRQVRDMDRQVAGAWG